MPSDDAAQCRTLWLAVLNEAFEDLKRYPECTCADPDTYRCRACARQVDPWEEHDACKRASAGTHQVGCRHRFRSARRLLLGTSVEWREQLDTVCAFAGVDAGKVKDVAMKALKVRRRDAA